MVLKILTCTVLCAFGLLKGQYYDYLTPFFHDSRPSGPVIHMLKYFYEGADSRASGGGSEGAGGEHGGGGAL